MQFQIVKLCLLLIDEELSHPASGKPYREALEAAKLALEKLKAFY